MGKDKIVDHGVYQEQVLHEWPNGTRLSLTSMGMPNLQDDVARVLNLRDRLRARIRHYVDNECSEHFSSIYVNLGDGAQGYVVSAPPEAGIRHAADVLELIDSLALTPNVARIFLMGVNAGQKLECIKVLPSQPHALKGKLSSKGSDKGVKIRQQKALARAEQTLKEYLKHKRGKVSYTAAVARTADELKLNIKTVDAHLKLKGITAKNAGK